MNLFALKTLLKTSFKNQRIGKFQLSKTLAKNPKEWGLYRPIRKLAVRLMWQPDRLAVGWPADRQRLEI